MSEAIKKFKIEGETVVQLSDKYWICPNCKLGNENGDGLCSDDDRDLISEEHPTYYYYNEELLCYGCGWGGCVSTLYRRALKSEDHVQCPCCKGSGSVSTKKAAKYKGYKKDQASK